jgi:hypothetical protein
MMTNDLHAFLILVLIPTILVPIPIKDSIAVVLKIGGGWSHHSRQYDVVKGGGWPVPDGSAAGKEGASSSGVIRKDGQAKEGEAYEKEESQRTVWHGLGGEGGTCEVGMLQVRKGHRHPL